MRGDVRGGIRLAARSWPGLVAIAAMVTIAGVLSSFILSDVISQTQVLQGGAALRANHAVTFTPYYTSSQVSAISAAAMDELGAEIANGDAYSTVVSNVQVDDPNFADGTPVVVLVGDAVLALFPALGLCSPAPCAMRGAQLDGRYIAPVQFAGESFSHFDTLAPSATLLDPNVAGLQLDSKIVLRVPAANLTQFDPYEREEILTKAVLLAPGATVLDRYLTRAVTEGLFLVPHDVSTDQPSRFRDIMIRSMMYVIGLVAFLSLALLAMWLVATSIFSRNRNAFAIRRIYGAPPGAVVLRVGGFFASVFAAPIAVLMLVTVVGGSVRTAAVGLVTLLVGAVVIMTVASAARILAHDPVER